MANLQIKQLNSTVELTCDQQQLHTVVGGDGQDPNIWTATFTAGAAVGGHLWDITKQNVSQLPESISTLVENTVEVTEIVGDNVYEGWSPSPGLILP